MGYAYIYILFIYCYIYIYILLYTYRATGLYTSSAPQHDIGNSSGPYRTACRQDATALGTGRPQTQTSCLLVVVTTKDGRNDVDLGLNEEWSGSL